MPKRVVTLLVLVSIVNVIIGFGAFVFGGFSTAPHMDDVTMRLRCHILNGIVLTALAGVVAPWMLARNHRYRSALLVAIMPFLFTVIAVLSFLSLDSWLRRTFGG